MGRHKGKQAEIWGRGGGRGAAVVGGRYRQALGHAPRLKPEAALGLVSPYFCPAERPYATGG